MSKPMGRQDADFVVDVVADMLDQVFDSGVNVQADGNAALIASSNIAVARVLQEIRDLLRERNTR